MTPTLLMAMAAGLIWLIGISFYPRQAVWLVMLWVPVQGWFQLNVFDDSSQTVLLYEYQLAGIYLILLVRTLRFPREYLPPRVFIFAAPFALWVLALIPNSVGQTGSILTGIGVRTYLFPLPLVWLGFLAFRNREELELFGSAFLFEAAVIGIVAAMQFSNLVTPWGDIVDVPTGYNTAGALRPPGTFSAPGHLGMYVLAAIPLAIGFIGLRTTWRRGLCYKLGLCGAVLALVVNSQRATVVSLCVCLPLIAALARRTRVTRAVAISCGVAALGTILGLWVVQDAFVERLRSITNDANYTLVVAPSERMIDALRQPILGAGLGSASPGTGRLEVAVTKDAESFGAAVIYETGAPGLLMFIVLLAALLAYGLHAVVECRPYDTVLLASGILVYEAAICLNSWSYDPLHYPPSRILFWFWAGVLLALPKLSLSPRRALVPVRRVQEATSLRAPVVMSP